MPTVVRIITHPYGVLLYEVRTEVCTVRTACFNGVGALPKLRYADYFTKLTVRTETLALAIGKRRGTEPFSLVSEIDH